jgi:purine-nucleoside phosphorylase
MARTSQSPPSSTAARLDDCIFAIRKRYAGEVPRVGVVLGSGLGRFADAFAVKIPYGDLPHMVASGVAGHAGNFCFGTTSGVPVVCMQGRVHAYEGHSIDTVVHGVRVMARLGVQCVLLTNAAGGLDPAMKPGDLMAIADHVNLTGASPLVGPNDDVLGPRFPDMTGAYDPAIRGQLHVVAEGAGIALREGVYAAMMGPQYETPAEIRMLRQMGAHAVGMSTVHEVIALRHMGVRVGALSCITNLAAGVGGVGASPLSHAEVEATAASRAADLTKLLGGWIAAVARLP